MSNQEIESSLTSPTDKTKEYKSDISVDPLNKEELEIAKEILIENRLEEFSRIERRFCDPGIPGQKYSLHSFIPSKTAVPDENGIFGMLKIRGTYSTIEETLEKSEDLIKNHDSYHKIYTGFVGKPMPVTESSKFSFKINEIDIQKEISKTIRNDIKAKREIEKREVDEIRGRERLLKEEIEQEATDPYEKYTCLCVKRAQTIWGYFEHKKKMNELLEVFQKTVVEIETMDEEDDDYKNKYFDRYKEARVRAGIPEDKNDTSFMKYLGHDINTIDEFLEIEKEIKNLEGYKESRKSGATITVVHKDKPDINEIKPESNNNFGISESLA